jgi:hypothetical protein
MRTARKGVKRIGVVIESLGMSKLLVPQVMVKSMEPDHRGLPRISFGMLLAASRLF